jgi:hypothetical protein
MGPEELFERASRCERLAAKADDPKVRETLLLVALQFEEEAYATGNTEDEQPALQDHEQR